MICKHCGGDPHEPKPDHIFEPLLSAAEIQIAAARASLERHFLRKAIIQDRRLLDLETFAARYPGVPYRIERAPRPPSPPKPLAAALARAIAFGRTPSDEAIEAWNEVLTLNPPVKIEARAGDTIERMATKLDRLEQRFTERAQRSAERAESHRQAVARRRVKQRERYLKRLGRPPMAPGRPVPPPWIVDGEIAVVCETRVNVQLRRWLIASGDNVQETVALTAAEALEIWKDARASESTASLETVATILEDHSRGSTSPDWVALPPREVVPCRGYFYVGLKPYRCQFSAAKALRVALTRGSRSGA